METMTDWQVTAKTIFCEAVDDEVTVLVYKDASVRCTGYHKYTSPNEVTRQLTQEKSRKLKRSLKCEGEQCPRVTQYKAKILAEESK